MSKRKSSNVEDELERLLKKVKKLEKKVRKRDDQEVRPVTPDLNPYYDDTEQPSQGTSENPLEPQPPTEDNGSPVGIVIAEDNDQTLAQGPADDALPNDQILEIPLVQSDSANKGENPSTSAPNAVDAADLDDDILEILGDDPSSTVKLGPETRKELASRFQHTATEGLSKEIRKELINKYPLPANCLHVGAPTLNPEIKAALPENILKRDKGIETKQKEMSSAISCLTDIISLHLSTKERNNEVLKKLMDIGRILCDIQHGDSVTRRNFILFAVKDDMQEHLKSTKIDTSLFGEKLSETLKTAKAVNKSGAELKINANKTAPKNKPSVSQPLNRKAAPPRRQPGAAPYAPRTREYAAPRASPAPPPPPRAPAYRPSSTQQQFPPPPQNRRRY